MELTAEQVYSLVPSPRDYLNYQLVATLVNTDVATLAMASLLAQTVLGLYLWLMELFASEGVNR